MKKYVSLFAALCLLLIVAIPCSALEPNPDNANYPGNRIMIRDDNFYIIPFIAGEDEDDPSIALFVSTGTPFDEVLADGWTWIAFFYPLDEGFGLEIGYGGISSTSSGGLSALIYRPMYFSGHAELVGTQQRLIFDTYLGIGELATDIGWSPAEVQEAFRFGSSDIDFTNFDFTVSKGPFAVTYEPPVGPSSISLSQVTPSPIYPGTTCQMAAEVTGTGDFDDAIIWSVSGLDPNTSIDENGLVTIGRAERMSVIVRAASVQDPTIYAEYELPVSWPTDQMQIAPSKVYDLPLSTKERILYFRLETPEGNLFLGTNVEWSVVTSAGAEDYFTINPNNGALTVKSNAPVGATATVYWRYTVGGEEYETPRTNGAGVEIVSVDQAINDQLTPTPEQSDKAEDLENGIRDEVANIENNNSMLESLTPSRPSIKTDLTLDPVYLTAASPLIANIWSISGLGSIIAVVLAIATVAYIFFGKKDG